MEEEGVSEVVAAVTGAAEVAGVVVTSSPSKELTPALQLVARSPLIRDVHDFTGQMMLA